LELFRPFNGGVAKVKGKRRCKELYGIFFIIKYTSLTETNTDSGTDFSLMENVTKRSQGSDPCGFVFAEGMNE
jgi:hypothetical protein